MFFAGSLTTRAPIEIRPPVDSSRPATMRSVVVLPQPEGPSSVTNSPASTARPKRSTATTPPKSQQTSSITSVGIGPPGAPGPPRGQSLGDPPLEISRARIVDHDLFGEVRRNAR